MTESFYLLNPDQPGAAHPRLALLFDSAPAIRFRGPKGVRPGDVVIAGGRRWLVYYLAPERREAICRGLVGSQSIRRLRARQIERVERAPRVRVDEQRGASSMTPPATMLQLTIDGREEQREVVLTRRAPFTPAQREILHLLAAQEAGGVAA